MLKGRLLYIINLDWTEPSERGLSCTFLRSDVRGPKAEEPVLPGALEPEAAAVGPALGSVTILGNWQMLLHPDLVLFIALTS